MAKAVKRTTLLGILVAALMCVALLAVAVPQEAYAAQGWNSDNKGFWYEYDNKGHYYKNGWQKITITVDDGYGPEPYSNWYYFNKNGYAKSGWQKSGKYWYYLDATGGGAPHMLAMTFIRLNGKVYYFDISGRMASGWCKTHLPVMGYSMWVYANKSGELQHGWRKIKGKWYLLGHPSSSLDSYNFTSYYGAQGDWVTEKGVTYYLGGWDSCAMVTGWQKIDGKWYYFAKSGAMQKGKWVGNYWLGSDGVMATDAWVDNDKYYVDKNGKWVKGKKK